MLTTDDVSALFEAMRTAYGGQWKHGPPAVRVWRNAMNRYSAERVQWAANEALHHYVDHPPTLPQFLSVLRTRDRAPTTYLPAPEVPSGTQGANLVLMRVLTASKGVDSACLRNLAALKNALLEEPDMTGKEMERQLMDLADDHDREAKARESEAARQRQFGTMAGFVP